MLVEYVGDVDCLQHMVGKTGYCMLDDVEVTFSMSARDKENPIRRYVTEVKITCKPEELKALNFFEPDDVEFVKDNPHYNGRVICTQFKSADTHFTVGKEYDIINGQIYTDNGEPYFGVPIDKLDDTGLWLKFEPVRG